jgi:hypothetical protein
VLSRKPSLIKSKEDWIEKEEKRRMKRLE